MQDSDYAIVGQEQLAGLAKMSKKMRKLQKCLDDEAKRTSLKAKSKYPSLSGQITPRDRADCPIGR
jgi:hypothetical protein